MANNNKDHKDPMSILSEESNPISLDKLSLLAGGSGTNIALTPSAEPDIQEMQRNLLTLQLRTLKKQVAEQEEKEGGEREWRRQNAIQRDKTRKLLEEMQGMCPHLKPNGQPAIAGQKDHSQNYIFICAYCSKTFDGRTLPPHLRIPAEFVGGPQV